MKAIREQLIDIILKVAMKHHDDISKSDEDAACDAADEILKQFPQIILPLDDEEKIKELSESIFRGYYVPLYQRDKPINEMTSYEQGLYKSTYSIVSIIIKTLRELKNEN